MSATSKDRYRGLTKGDSRALKAFDVEPLDSNEVTYAYRITAPRWVHDVLRVQKGRSKARAIGGLLAQKLVSDSSLPYTGDPETDDILGDPELTRRLLLYKKEYGGLDAEQVGTKIAEEIRTGQL